MATLAPAAAARIGPNSVTQLAAALEAHGGAGLADRVFAAAKLSQYRAAPPVEMIPEDEALAAHQAMRAALPADIAAAIAADSGARTGAYILRHRIPKPAQVLLRALPSHWAARLLAKAIQRHAWTFAGSGALGIEDRPGRPLTLVLTGNRLAAGPCLWHQAVFETLFRRLASPKARVVETACEGDGASACRFTIHIDNFYW